MEFKRGLFPLLFFAFSETLVATEVGGVHVLEGSYIWEQISPVSYVKGQ